MSQARERVQLSLAKLDELRELLHRSLAHDHRAVALELSQQLGTVRDTLEVLDTALALEAGELTGSGDPRTTCLACGRPALEGMATCGESWCRSVAAGRAPRLAARPQRERSR